MASSARTSRLRRAARWILVPALALLSLALLEAVARVLVLRRHGIAALQRPLAERRHTAYDAELGWASVPGFSDPDFYGPGRALHTNAQGFRGTRDVASERPAGRRRLVCSGDSFTLGYGVSDEDAWCAVLARLEPSLETVNMGQGGYGLDQAYLWYRRDGLRFAHDAQVLAFIGEDFVRMGSDRFLRYGKPVLRVREGRLVTENVPVPRDAYWAPWLTENLDLLLELRSLALLRGCATRFAPPPRSPEPDVADLALRLFDELAALHRARGSELLLVHLPMRQDRLPHPADAWRAHLAREAAHRGIAYLDLVPALRRLAAAEAEALFIAPGSVDFPGAEGHYTAQGNRFVAEHVLDALRRDPRLAPRLGLAR